MGNDFSKGVDSAVSIITGIITGDMTGGLAGASAPWLAEQIKIQAGDNETARLVAHAILGAVVAELQGNSALSGGAGAVAGEVAADIIRKQLYGKEVKDLTEEEKQTISALSQLASGLAVAAGGGNFGDASAAISSSKNAVENNALLQQKHINKITELADGNTEEFAKLYAAACAIKKCSAEFADDDPNKAKFQEIEAMGNSEELESYRKILRDIDYVKTNFAPDMIGFMPVTYETIEKLFDYTDTDKVLDTLKYANNEYSIMTRAGGAFQLGFALTEGAAGIALIPTCETGVGCIASGAMIWHAADSGGTAWSIIIDGQQYKTLTAKSLSDLLNISETDAEMIFDLAGATATLKGSSSLFKNSVVNTSKLSVKELDKINKELSVLNAEKYKAQAQQELIDEINKFTSRTQATNISTMIGAYDPVTGKTAIGYSNGKITADALHPTTINYIEKKLGVKIGDFTSFCKNKAGACAEVSAADNLIRQGVQPERIKFTQAVRPRMIWDEKKITKDAIIPPCKNCKTVWPKGDEK